MGEPECFAMVLERTGIRSIETYVYRRQLRWLGHLSRMPWNRLPRKLLSSWVYQSRPRGRPVYRWGEGMEKAVHAIGLGVTEWVEVAADRAKWRALVRQYGEPEGEVKSNNNNNNNSNSSNSNSNSNSSSSSSNGYVPTMMNVTRPCRGWFGGGWCNLVQSKYVHVDADPSTWWNDDDAGQYPDEHCNNAAPAPAPVQRKPIINTLTMRLRSRYGSKSK